MPRLSRIDRLPSTVGYRFVSRAIDSDAVFMGRRVYPLPCHFILASHPPLPFTSREIGSMTDLPDTPRPPIRVSSEDLLHRRCFEGDGRRLGMRQHDAAFRGPVALHHPILGAAPGHHHQGRGRRDCQQGFCPRPDHRANHHADGGTGRPGHHPDHRNEPPSGQRGACHVDQQRRAAFFRDGCLCGVAGFDEHDLGR